MRLAVEGVKRAKAFVKDVEFSPEDASRTEPDFFVARLQAAIEAGATTMNIPDTVGWAVPDQYRRADPPRACNVPEFIGEAIISVHCHNDLGLAVANSLAAVKRRAPGRCTVNGIGERAGNARSKKSSWPSERAANSSAGSTTGINTREIVKTSRLVSRMSGFVVQRSKAIVGENAFAHVQRHSPGWHPQEARDLRNHGPREVGWGRTELPLTKHSGRAAWSPASSISASR